MKYFRDFTALLFLCSLTSCATLFKGTKADITLNGPTDEPVRVIATCDTLCHQRLPATVRLKKKNLQNALTVESDSYEFARLVPGRRTDWWSVAQVLGPFGLIGLIIDGITGAVNLPKQQSYTLNYSTKTDSMAKLPNVIESNVTMYRKLQPKRFLRHEVRLALGLGNLDEKTCDQIYDELYDNYRMEGATIIGRFHRSLSVSYDYHINRRWAVGVLCGLNHWRREMNNGGYCDLLNWAWRDLSDYWLYKGDAGKALFYKELRAPFCYGEMTHQMYYAMPTVKYTWMIKDTEVYSGLALGVAYRHLCFKGHFDGVPYSTDRSKWKLGTQVTLLGVRWGKEHWGGFFELGVGHQGYFIGGISYRL